MFVFSGNLERCEMSRIYNTGSILQHILRLVRAPEFVRVHQMSTHSSPSKTYTLAGSPEWQKTYRCKPITEFSHREREFIKESLTSEWDQDFTGTRVIYIEPEGSESMSMISRDDEDEQDNSGLKDGQSNTQGKGRFKKMAKRLYPAKVVGGAKAVGGAFRHPMVTSRKMNRFVRRNNRTTSSRDACRDRTPAGLAPVTTYDLPPITRSATMTDLHACAWDDTAGESFADVTNLSVKHSRRGILRRRNSAPYSLKPDEDIIINVGTDSPPAGDEATPPVYAPSRQSDQASLRILRPAK